MFGQFFQIIQAKIEQTVAVKEFALVRDINGFDDILPLAQRSAKPPNHFGGLFRRVPFDKQQNGIHVLRKCLFQPEPVLLKRQFGGNHVRRVGVNREIVHRVFADEPRGNDEGQNQQPRAVKNIAFPP